MKKVHLYTACFILLCGFTIKLKAQLPSNLKFETYSMKNGLPNNTVNSITQDKYGFIWIGTNNGLSRFDGVKFTNYFASTDSTGLIDNLIFSVSADVTGRIWVGTGNGLCYYSYAGNSFHPLDLPDNQKIEWVSSIIKGDGNDLWFFSNIGLCKINTALLKLSVIGEKFANGYAELFKDKTGRIWISQCSKGLYMFNPKENKLISMTDKMEYPLNGCFEGFFSDKEDEVWLANITGLPGGLKKWNISEQKTDLLFLTHSAAGKTEDYFNDIITYPYLTGDSILWCNRGNELVLFNRITRQFEALFNHKPSDEASLPIYKLGKKFIDKDYNLWIGGQKGLIKMNPNNRQINSYRIPEMFTKDEPASIRKIVPHKNKSNNYWLITYGGGILLYDFAQRKTEKWYRYETPENNREDENGSWNYDALYDKDGKLWVASGIGLSYYDESKDVFSNITITANSNKSENVIFRITEGNHNDLWLATNAGIKQFNTKSKQFITGKTFTAGKKDKQSYLTEAVYYLKFYTHGRLLAGSRNGLAIIDTATGNIQKIKRQNELIENVFSKNYIWGIDVDKNENIWISSYGGYIWKLAYDMKTITDYGKLNGLTINIFRDIFIDSLQNVWASSKDGVFKKPMTTNRFIKYNTSDGLFDTDPSQGRWSIIENKIFAGYNGAFSTIDLYDAKNTTLPFQVWITGIRAMNKELFFLPDSTNNRQLQFKQSQNFIELQFTAPEFKQPEKIQFYYKLEGFNKEWVHAGPYRFAAYTNLNGGKYAFKVKAVNSDNMESSNIAEITFTVQNVFWKTSWFWTLIALVVSIAAVYLFRRKLENVRKEAYFKQKISETEMMALRAQMNPHFIFNSLNSIENFIMRNDRASASEYLNKFSKLIRSILNSSRSTLVPFSKDMETIQLYADLELLRFRNHFQLEITVDEQLSMGDYSVPPLLILPFVENAIIHGLAPSENKNLLLKITATVKDGKLRYTIIDNGIGREKSKAYNLQNKPSHVSMGMLISEERIRIFNSQYQSDGSITITDLYNNEQQPAGTKVELVIKTV